MNSGPLPVVLQEMKYKINYYSDLLDKYPHLHIEQTWDGERLFTKDVNQIITSFEPVGSMGFDFYCFDEQFKTKIYADPSGVNVCTDEYYEVDWLPELFPDNLNPKVLVDLMKEINSHYINNSYYHDKLPILKEWFNKFYNNETA
jgi:hypothetical protein